jgi:mRNA interferase MazF
MEELVRGDVIVVSFPFRDLTNVNKRPALVCATVLGDDVILCQITGRANKDRYSIPLEDSDISGGNLYAHRPVREVLRESLK